VRMAPRRSTGSTGSTGYDDLLLDRQLCFALHAASRAVVREYTPLLSDLGLTYPQYVVMMALWADVDRPHTVGEIGEAVQMDSGTLTPLLKRLERDGLVSRSRDQADERRVNVMLTDAGLALRDQATAVPRAVASRFGMTLAEGMHLKAQLERLTAHLGAADAS
jgi:MarR family transcriptional regulator, organic hydroperoxide resistance regulator